MQMPKLFSFPQEWIAFAVFFGVIVFFIGLAEIFRKTLKWSPESSRKLVHVLVGILVSFAPFILSDGRLAILLAVLFTAINAFALRGKAFQGMHATDRVSYGTVYFPIAFGLLVLIYWDRDPSIFLTAMLILTFADPAATLVGERQPEDRKFILWSDPKSLAGSLAFFLTAFLIVFFLFPWFRHLQGSPGLIPPVLMVVAFLTALFAMGTEAVSRQGSDNLTLSLASAFMLDLALRNLENGTFDRFLLWSLVISLGLYGAHRLRSLNLSGLVGTIILGTYVLGVSGWSGLLPLIVFFILSSLLSKLADYRKPDYGIQKRGSNRDIVQVYANAGVGLILLLVYYLGEYTHVVWYMAFLASLAAATADTWESEIGSFSRSEPRHILSFERVPRGYSGGVSLLGSFGGVLGAAVIALTGAWLQPSLREPWTLILITLSGLAGSIVDSLLGAAIQGKFQCEVCGKHTEKHVHCGRPTVHIGGWQRMDNDWVNLLCTVSGPAIFLALYLFFN